jgi:TPR repeat protein
MAYASSPVPEIRRTKWRHSSISGVLMRMVARLCAFGGFCSFFGLGCDADRVEAQELFRLGADQDIYVCQMNDGLRLLHKSAAANDIGTKSFKSSGDSGLASAQVNYSAYLFEGRGVCTDITQSVRYARLAANQGQGYGAFDYGICLLARTGFMLMKVRPRDALNDRHDNTIEMQKSNLGYCFAKGVGVGRNSMKAAQYFKSGADYGHPVSEFKYESYCYTRGKA